MSPVTLNSAHEHVKFVEGSLRSLVEKWLWLTQAAPARLTVFSRTASGGTRFVRVEVSRQERPVSVLFFRHTDGTWQVFPPAIQRPMMRFY
ncbi:hypothetical protein M0D69_40400 [Caballeronia sp. SEWSISQ10-4 2]|uniref:hypothetical protein n=1 Tax=Caballeronia sp. SEWSISQ10-4 2 TaxID=2937438 RepID=UPI000E748AD4|nr:hypothetical protein [Caballeronia sp. SEWSISQ10-4 2]MDN7184171.1 hypothetical protein [Caballeronia sp. SEWSISQ10-4 2]